MAAPFNPNNLVRSVDPLLSPADLKRFDPLLPQQEKLVAGFRKTIREILDGSDARLLAVVGPCSIHDVVGADDYAQRLSALAHELSESLFVVMRVYFEKPRGASDWSGFLTDPHLDGNFRVEDGLKASRKFLHHLVRMELPAGTEALDPVLPAYLGDMFSWMVIGQRASESNAHRMIASGLPVPVGFKNGPREDGLARAADAIRAATRPHDYLGLADDGRLSVFHTCGNEYAHLVLRGSGDSPNYGSASITRAEEALERAETRRPRADRERQHVHRGLHARELPRVGDAADPPRPQQDGLRRLRHRPVHRLADDGGAPARGRRALPEGPRGHGAVVRYRRRDLSSAISFAQPESSSCGVSR